MNSIPKYSSALAWSRRWAFAFAVAEKRPRFSKDDGLLPTGAEVASNRPDDLWVHTKYVDPDAAGKRLVI